MHSLSLSQLHAVCAAHRIAVPRGSTAEDVVALLERASEHMRDADGALLTHAEGQAEAEGEGEDGDDDGDDGDEGDEGEEAE